VTAPTDNIVRAWADPSATQLRASADGTGSTMVGHFAVFNEWTEIKSVFEGNFLERIDPAAFDDTFKARAGQIRVLYDHGADPMIGNKPLGTPTVLRADRTGAYYEVELFDSSYVNDLKPAIRSGQLGASFRFKVISEEWNQPSQATSDNPGRLEERTITGAELYEFGPVTFPAYPSATAGMRSRTDEFIEHFLRDPTFVARFTERAGLATTERILATLSPTLAVTVAELEERDDTPTPDDAADGAEDPDLIRRSDYFDRATRGYVAHISRLKEAS
jgi:HK97 family phage prohead protease